jgi:P27 family predicted phage terminase small subunit
MGARGRTSAAALAIVAPKPSPVPQTASGLPEPPAHLSKDAKRWWRNVVTEFQLEDHHLRLLESACSCWDRAEAARKEVAAHGKLTVADANGNLRAHPLIAVERDARTLLARVIRELDLDSEGPTERSRPPALRSNR